MTQSTHTLELSPADLKLEVVSGTQLQDVLFTQRVEFPCGGRGRCKGCRVKVLKGILPVGDEEKNLLTGAELAGGWRLACRHSIAGDLKLELAQWEMPILGDQSTFKFAPREGLGVAIDLGTTTIAAQLLDLKTGGVLSVVTALNAQARHGGDIMSRVEFALCGGQPELQRQVREQLGGMASQLVSRRAKLCPTWDKSSDAGNDLNKIIIVGNTVMHHLFCGVGVAPLAGHPFEPQQPGRFRFSARELGWNLPEKTVVEFLPCIGGFVGSDILAGIVATGLHESRELTALGQDVPRWRPW